MSHFSVESWRRFIDANGVGSVLDATVVQVVPFGAFLEVAPGVHGLWHHAEWSPESAAPAIGSTVSVRILAVDDERHRVSLAAA
ncbi:S1 RNA-binding domain-containing protein [Nocardia arizonensis]|uniref:S1 RNA-binding domain-containing protein n=1 Tax=Nocardia arizonensis TaxID=1141647 RepID=UPI0006D26DDB|nr:S1 RNA-binding domain-containing protein [Nocardia arizonensis]